MKSTRSIFHLFSLSLLCALLVNEPNALSFGHTGRQPHALVNQAPFTALVTKTEAQFVFPLPVRSLWSWRQPATKDNAQEYRINVTVQNDERKYAFGFYLWKRSGAVPQSGTLSELIKAGQASVFGRNSAGRFEIIREAGIKLKLAEDRLVVLIRGRENVERLFSSHPSEVTFEIKLLDEALISQTVPVVYQD